ncbi:hypothetical protein EBR43_09640 [bacterium]|nr:hypothetical protein [bacterium]
MQLLNENEIYETWSPIIESKTGMTDRSKVEWLSKYCHFHSLNESAGAYNSLGVLNGMGNVLPAGNYQGGAAGAGPAGFYYNNTYDAGRPYVGSGDKFPSLLPLAIQVAAKTVGFDIVPVIPMAGPTGVLSYLDYVYAGGSLGGTSTDSTNTYTANTPDMVKIPTTIASPATGLTVGNVYAIGVALTAAGYDLDTTTTSVIYGVFIGNSRIDGFPIFQIKGITNGKSVSDAIPSAGTADIYNATFASATNIITVTSGTPAASTAGSAVLVKTLEDHIQGFSGAGPNNTNDWQGPYVDGTKNYDPMLRGVGETTYYKSLGLSTFTKFVEAGTFQVAASVTTEQIQDLNKQFGIDVVSMIENALVNEVSQAINKHILSRGFALGWSNHSQFFITESTNLNLNLVIGGAATYTVPNFIGKQGTAVTGGSKPGAVAGPASGTFENLSTVQRRLYSRILAAANVVANRGRRGPANFIVTNSQIASALQDISQFTFAPFTNTLTQNNGTLYPVGSLAGMTVYVDQNMSFGDTRVLVGRKGADDEPGMKFMPYMMAESIQTISEGTMSPKIAVKSRYSLVEAGHHPETMYFCFHVNTGTATAII